MNQVTLLFSDTSAIADFILTHAISNAEVNSKDQKLTAPLSVRQIDLAVQQYGATEFKKPVFLFNDEEDD